MEMSELRALLTPEGLRLLDETGPVESTSAVAAAVGRLRAAGHGPDLVSAVVTQARLRSRAASKFGPFASRMLFTPAGLEQATRLSVAARHAGRFRDAGRRRIADLGCGIGGDALGFAALGLEVAAVDADELTAAVAAYNLAPFGDTVHVSHARAEDVDLADRDAVWLDPARRPVGGANDQRLRADEYSPALSWAFDVAARIPTGIKLGPGFDRDSIPDDVEAQWISVDGSTIELALFSRELARDGVRRAALVVRGDEAHEITSLRDADDVEPRSLGAFVHEPDGAVIRARLIGDVARSLDAGTLDERIAYLTSDAALTSPFVQSFRVRETMPANPKAINTVLKAHGIGILEIKKRGMDIDPAAFRKKLTLRGEASATLFLTRVGDRRRAILADRVPAAE